MSRRTTAVLIISLWVGALGWLAERHYLGEGPAEQVARWPVPPGSAFHAIRLLDRQVGLATFTVDTLIDEYRVVELWTLDLPPLEPGKLRRTSARVEAIYSRSLKLRTWNTDLLTFAGRSSTRGEVIGDTLLSVVNEARGELPETLTVRLRRPVVLPGAVSLVAASRGLPQPGSRLNIEVFDPIDQEIRVERLTVAAESVFVVPDSAMLSPTLKRWTVAHNDTLRAWRLDEVEQGLRVSRWIDAAGLVIRAEHPLGAVRERAAFELVQTNFRALPPPLWDTSSAGPDFTTPLDREVRSRPPMRVLARVAPEAALPAGIPSLTGGWQQRSGDTLQVGPPPSDAARDSAPELALPVWSLVQIDSATRVLADRIVGAERRPEVIARLLTAWVRRNVALREGPGTGSSPRILANRRGTAEERVLLLAALARAAGLTARPVWGLVRWQGRWELHPWAEVWTDDWYPVDPATADRGPDLGRIRLATGGGARLLDLAIRAGRLRLEMLEETS